MRVFLTCLFFSLTTTACNQNQEQATRPEIANADPVEVHSQDELERAYFASGCFWCVEPIYESVPGVKEAVSGYSGGHTENPTYKSISTGKTGHAETVEVTYDPSVVSFGILVDVYFGSQDPTQNNGQGPDIGSQYRSIIFYQNEEQKQLIQQKKQALQEELGEEIAAEVLPFQKFWKAEDHHQDYERRNPLNPYIQNVSIPRLEKFQGKFPELLEEDQH